MKKLLLLIFVAAFYNLSQAQQPINQIAISSFTVKNQLPGNIDKWASTPGSIILVAQRKPQASVGGPKLVVQIKGGGAIICGNRAPAVKSMEVFDIRNFQAGEIISALGQCKELKEGSYTLCVQFFNIDNFPISQEVCRDFSVRGEQKPEEYAPPTLINPENGKQFTEKQLQQAVTFRWTPLVPKPKEPVTYRLKVWQLMQGQNGTQAMRTNQPIVTKDVDNITQATVNGVITGPCKPPYLCDFIWNVQALNRNGKPVGSNNGTSEPYTFKMNSGGCIGDLKIDSVKCTGAKDGKNIYRMCVTYKADANNTCTILFNDPQNASLNLSLPSNNINNIIYSFTAGTSISNMSPAIGSLPATITAGNSVSVCFDVTANPGTPSVTIGAFGLCNDGMQNTLHNTGNDLDSIPLPPCECDPCRDMNVVVEKDSLKLPKSGNPSQLNLTGMFTGLNNNNIKKVTAEIIYFNIQQTKDKECAKCVFDSKQYGNFILPASPLSGYNGPVLNKPDYSRLITWNSTVIKDCGGQPHGDGTGLPNDGKLPLSIDRQTPKTDFGDKTISPGNPPVGPIIGPPKFGIPISVPDANSLSCCGDVIKICIRYTFYDFCCHTCEVIKCYEIKREK